MEIVMPRLKFPTIVGVVQQEATHCGPLIPVALVSCIWPSLPLLWV